MDDTKDQDTATMGNNFARAHPWTARRNLMPAFNGAANEAIAQEIEADLTRKLDLSHGRLFIARSLMERTNKGPGCNITMAMKASFNILSRDQAMLEDILWESGRMAERKELSPEMINKIKMHLTERFEFLRSIMSLNCFCESYLWTHYVVLNLLKSKFFPL